MNTMLENQDLLLKEAGLWESAIAILLERINSLPQEVKEDLAELVYELTRTASESERGEIKKTLQEILIPRLVGGIVSVEAGVTENAKLTKRAERIGNRIRRFREGRDWTQAELAEKSGLPQSHISRLEAGKHSPSHVTLCRLAKALEITVARLDCAINKE